MHYFLKEEIIMSSLDMKKLKLSKSLASLKDYQKKCSLTTFTDVAQLSFNTEVFFYKNFMYYAIENYDIDFMKLLLSNGYYLKDLQKDTKYHFTNTIQSVVSHIGKYYQEDMFKFVLLKKNKINLSSIIKSVILNKDIKVFNKIQAIYNINKAINFQINIEDTEIFQNIIEKENLEGIKSLYKILGNVDFNGVYYYLNAVKNEEIIDYYFSKNIRGDNLHNGLALSALIHNTERFKKFYLRMKKPKIDGALVSQIIEIENIDLLYFLYNEDVLKLIYPSNIIKDIVFHSIFTNKLNVFITLLKLLDYDLSDYSKIKKQYTKEIPIDIDNFIVNLAEKQQLKKRLENNLKANKKEKVVKI